VYVVLSDEVALGQVVFGPLKGLALAVLLAAVRGKALFGACRSPGVPVDQLHAVGDPLGKRRLTAALRG
jgi:hypothetical protein